jgi:uncharacterized membrane protein YbaN (DUF454 family)
MEAPLRGPATEEVPKRRWSSERMGRFALAGAGVLLVGLATLGALLPGLPTTIFLIGASYCFTKSCPRLEEALLKNNRLLRPYLVFLESGRPMPRRARVAAIGTMWLFIGVSLFALAASGALGGFLAAAIVVAGACGTVAILTYRRAAGAAKPALSGEPSQLSDAG